MDFLNAPYRSVVPLVQKAPVLLTSPHSGRFYPPAFLAASRLDATAIRRSEDSFVDDLVASAPSLGVPLLTANFPRAYCDVNREAWELDPAMFEDILPDFVNAASPRVSAGLGTIARIVGTGEPIYRRKLKFAEAQARIATCWQPYHAEVQRLIAATIQRFGVCLLVDCHSMPTMPSHRPVSRLAEIVLGDVHGTSCAAPMTGFVEAKLAGLGLRVRRNDPYAGGYITRFYGRPREGVHVLQIEVSRALYMHEAQFVKSEGFERLAGIFHELIAALAANAAALLPLRDAPLASAAE
ncbi:MAG: N-formylglutamate amidohydrolase [Acidocella sp.]|nr:N-formylglutamate amidohydrolase [Acidocella sp.]